jgi:hypothetical protein
MRSKKAFYFAFFFLVFYLFAMAEAAFAYLTPGAVNYVIQIIVAFSIGGVLSLRIFWHKINAFCKRFFSAKGVEQEEDEVIS